MVIIRVMKVTRVMLRLIRVGTHCIEKSEAGVCQVVNEDHLDQD